MASDQPGPSRPQVADQMTVFGLAWLSVRHVRQEGLGSRGLPLPELRNAEGVDDALFLWHTLPADPESQAEKFVADRFEAAHNEFGRIAASARDGVAAARTSRAQRLRSLERRALEERDTASVNEVGRLSEEFEREHQKLEKAVEQVETMVARANRRMARRTLLRRGVLAIARLAIVGVAIATNFLPTSDDTAVKLAVALALYVALDWLIIGQVLEPRLQRWNRRRASDDLRPAVDRMDWATAIVQEVQETASKYT